MSLAQRWRGPARRLVSMAIYLGIAIALVRWGGTARPGPLFTLGVALVSALLVAFASLLVWLFNHPEPTIAIPRSADLRSVLSALALGSMTSFFLGGLWDELWHRRYGGFGSDFLWPPHLLIYTGLLVFALFGFGGLWFTFRQPGSIRAKFQSEPHVGLLTLVCTFLVVSLPSDELWHRVYGKDITAWSLPHIIIASGGVFIALVAASMALSLVPRSTTWRMFPPKHLAEYIAILLITVGTLLLIHVGTTEWEAIRSIPQMINSPFAEAFWSRPVWLYPTVLATIAMFSSAFTLFALRRIGSATCVAVVIAGFRFVYLFLIGPEADQYGLHSTSYVLMLPPAIALDSWFFVYRHRPLNPIIQLSGYLLAGFAFVAVALPVIATTLVYPIVTPLTAPTMIVMSVLMAGLAGWSGASLSTWLTTLDRRPVLEAPTTRSRLLTIIGLSIIFLVTSIIVTVGQTYVIQ